MFLSPDLVSHGLFYIDEREQNILLTVYVGKRG